MKEEMKNFLNTEEGKFTESPLLFIVESAVYKTSKGSDYMVLKLSDGVTDVDCKLWNSTDLNKEELSVNTIVQVSGSFKTYNSVKGFIVTGYSVRPDISYDCFLELPENYNQCYEYILNKLNDIKNKDLKGIVEHFVNDEKFKSVPAAKDVHHNYYGGLVQHTCEVLSMAINIANTCSNRTANKDLIIAGSILHDIGKICSYTMDVLTPSMTKTGKLFDHIVEGYSLVKDYIKELGLDEDNDILQQLLHIILSHHGKLEFGSPVAPSTLEAFIISQADNLSFQINSLLKPFEELEPNEFSTKRNFITSSYLYKGSDKNEY